MSDNGNFSSSKDNLMYYFFQIGVFVVIAILILMRIITYKNTNNSWIWIINYIGMGIAILNILANKCFMLKDKNRRELMFRLPLISTW